LACLGLVAVVEQDDASLVSKVARRRQTQSESGPRVRFQRYSGLTLFQSQASEDAGMVAHSGGVLARPCPCQAYTGVRISLEYSPKSQPYY